MISKDPQKVLAGQIGARRRWGEQPRVVRLDSLSVAQRRLVVGLIDAFSTNEKAPAVSETSTGALEVRHDAAEPSAM